MLAYRCPFIVIARRIYPIRLDLCRILYGNSETVIWLNTCVYELFEEKMVRLTGELADLFEQSHTLETEIKNALVELKKMI